MTKIESIPSDQLTSLMDLILETAADLEEQKKGSAPQKRKEALLNDGPPKPSPF